MTEAMPRSANLTGAPVVDVRENSRWPPRHHNAPTEAAPRTAHAKVAPVLVVGGIVGGQQPLLSSPVEEIVGGRVGHGHPPDPVVWPRQRGDGGNECAVPCHECRKGALSEGGHGDGGAGGEDIRHVYIERLAVAAVQTGGHVSMGYRDDKAAFLERRGHVRRKKAGGGDP